MLKGNDVPTVMARVETALGRAGRSRAGRSSIVFVHDLVPDDIGISALRSPAEIQTDLPSGSTRPYVGRAITFSKRVARRGVRWYSKPIAEQQTRFNHASLDLAERLHLENDRLAGEVDDLREELESALTAIESLQADLQQLRAAGTGGAGEDAGAPPPSVRHALDYRRFEDRHRGDAVEVRALLKPYVETFRGCTRVVDLGCGRGEFLSLLRDAGVPASGVDLDEGMVQACLEQGLEAEVGDAIEALRRLEPGSVDGVFCSQVVEHLSTTELVTLLQLAHRRLAPGGRIVVETPNPESLSIFATFFYVDLTHTRPLHPEALVWAMESAGFVGVSVDRVQPVPPQARLEPLPDQLADAEGWRTVGANTERLNTLLYGPQHYAATARKATSA